MINFDDISGENIKELNPNWPQIPDHPYIKSIIEARESGKKNAQLNLMGHQPEIGTIFF